MVEMKNLTCYQIQERPARIIPARSDRPWMDATDDRFAYRCLPLSIANAMGWEILLPTTIAVTWNGGAATEDISVTVADPSYEVSAIAASHFGFGTLTFHTGYLFRTDPGVGIWARGVPNRPKDGIAPLEGIIETDWLDFTFTMNWKFTRPGTVHLREGRAVLLSHPSRLHRAHRCRSSHHADYRKAGTARGFRPLARSSIRLQCTPGRGRAGSAAPALAEMVHARRKRARWRKGSEPRLQGAACRTGTALGSRRNGQLIALSHELCPQNHNSALTKRHLVSILYDSRLPRFQNSGGIKMNMAIGPIAPPPSPSAPEVRLQAKRGPLSPPPMDAPLPYYARKGPIAPPPDTFAPAVARGPAYPSTTAPSLSQAKRGPLSPPSIGAPEPYYSRDGSKTAPKGPVAPPAPPSSSISIDKAA